MKWTLIGTVSLNQVASTNSGEKMFERFVGFFKSETTLPKKDINQLLEKTESEKLKTVLTVISALDDTLHFVQINPFETMLSVLENFKDFKKILDEEFQLRENRPKIAILRKILFKISSILFLI